MNDKLKPYVDKDGKLAKYAWPGGYPLAYLSGRGHVLCSECAGKRIGDTRDPPVDCGANWEDPSLYCEDCNERIESAYAEDDVVRVPFDAAEDVSPSTSTAATVSPCATSASTNAPSSEMAATTASSPSIRGRRVRADPTVPTGPAKP